MEKVYTIEELREIVRPIAQQYRVERVFLFGSYARGEADRNSDIDLRIDGGAFDTLFALGKLYADMEAALGKKLDLVMTDALREKLRDSAEGDPVRIFIRNMKRDEVVLYEEQRPS